MSTRPTTTPFEREGRRYQLVIGGGVANDAMSLELEDVTDPRETLTVLYGEKTGAGAYRFLSLLHLGPPAEEPLLLPLGLVEDFVGWLRSEL